MKIFILLTLLFVGAEFCHAKNTEYRNQNRFLDNLIDTGLDLLDNALNDLKDVFKDIDVDKEIQDLFNKTITEIKDEINIGKYHF